MKAFHLTKHAASHCASLPGRVLELIFNRCTENLLYNPHYDELAFISFIGYLIRTETANRIWWPRRCLTANRLEDLWNQLWVSIVAVLLYLE